MDNFEEKQDMQTGSENIEPSINDVEEIESNEDISGASEAEFSGDEVKPENHTFDNANPIYQNTNTFNKINYTDKKNINDYSPFSKGLKIFCAVLAAVILIVGSCAGGYFIGKNSSGTNMHRRETKLDLASKPKSGNGMTAAQVYEELNESIVGIRVYNSSSAYDASGVIYTEDGYIITNDHIYASVGAPKFKVYTFDGKEYDAEYVAGDIVSDLAVLKIKGGKGFKEPKFGNSDELICGESVFAVGRPSDASDNTSITAGTVSLTSRRVKSQSNYASSLIQTDSAINPGSSGGALVNMYGQVVGITSSKLSGNDYDAIGFAIPTVTVKRVVDQLISNGKVIDRAKLGITYTEINSVIKERQNLEAIGLLIASVSSDSDLYGKVSKDDIITHINGIEITKDDIVLDIIDASKAGDTVTLTVLSPSGSESEIKAKLGANIGESSFKIDESQITDPSNDQQSDKPQDPGTFDFPFGQ